MLFYFSVIFGAKITEKTWATARTPSYKADSAMPPRECFVRHFSLRCFHENTCVMLKAASINSTGDLVHPPQIKKNNSITASFREISTDAKHSSCFVRPKPAPHPDG